MNELEIARESISETCMDTEENIRKVTNLEKIWLRM
jgi:hypothetical protein